MIIIALCSLRDLMASRRSRPALIPQRCLPATLGATRHTGSYQRVLPDSRWPIFDTWISALLLSATTFFGFASLLDFPGAKQPAPVENWTTHWKHLDHELQAGKKAPQHPQKAHPWHAPAMSIVFSSRLLLQLLHFIFVPFHATKNLCLAVLSISTFFNM